MSHILLSRANRSPRLHCESLEHRELLSGKGAAQITFQEISLGSSASTYELLITGTKQNDSISISDNGTGTAANIFVSTGSGLDYTSVNAISEVFVATGRGMDNVTYELVGNLAPDVMEDVIVSASTTVSTGASNVANGGTLTFTANIVGKISDTSVLTVGAYTHSKATTTVTGNVTGEIDGTLLLGVVPLQGTFSGKAGNTNFNLYAENTIGVNGTLAAFAFGGKNKNNLSANYFGTNDGDIEIEETSYGKNDIVDADLAMTSLSTGTVGKNTAAEVGGSGKKLKARFTIYRGSDSKTTTGINAKIQTSSPKSVAQQTANVLDYVAGADTIVP